VPSPARRTQILAALKARLEQISVANGYWTNAAGHVHHGRVEVTADDVLSGTAVLALIPGRATKREGGRRMLLDLPLAIQGLVPADPVNPLDSVEPILADIKRAFFLPADEQLGGLVTHVAYVGESVTDRVSGGTLAGVEVEANVVYWEQYGLPEAG
jgi:hypothetical protein